MITDITHLKMEPISSRTQVIRNARELFDRHLRQLIVVDDCPAPRRLALDDVAGCRLLKFLSIDTMADIDAGLKRRLDLLGGDRLPLGQDGHKMDGQFGPGVSLAGQLLKNLQRIGTVASPPTRDTRGA